MMNSEVAFLVLGLTGLIFGIMGFAMGAAALSMMFAMKNSTHSLMTAAPSDFINEDDDGSAYEEVDTEYQDMRSQVEKVIHDSEDRYVGIEDDSL